MTFKQACKAAREMREATGGNWRPAVLRDERGRLAWFVVEGYL